MKKLTIGMVTYDDFDGVYFSIQAIRMFHKEILDQVEFIVIDNNPNEAHGAAVKGFCNWIVDQPIKYIPFTEYKSTAIRSKIFEHATTTYVLAMDCHVMFEQGALRKLIDYFDAGKDDNNLLQGPMVYDDLKNISTHFDLVWRAQMWGIWATDERGKNPNSEPFEIPSQGLGCFACRKNAWLGFNPKFRGFGGEEGYIHEKYRKAGKKAMCLPFLRWVHRFGRPNGVKYPLLMELKVKNYVTGFNEIGLNTQDIYDHFKEFTTSENIDKWFLDAGDSLKFRPKKTPSGSKNRGELIRNLNINGIGIEIGVQSGDFAKEILAGSNLHLIMLDSWRKIENYFDKANVNTDTHLAFMNNAVKKLLPLYEGRFTLIREFSEKAVTMFKDEYFDFVYLDADHSEKFVLNELERWWPKVKPGAVIAGHDYIDLKEEGNDFGVKTAVNKFFANKNIKVDSTDETGFPTWYVIKPK